MLGCALKTQVNTIGSCEVCGNQAMDFFVSWGSGPLQRNQPEFSLCSRADIPNTAAVYLSGRQSSVVAWDLGVDS